VSNDGASCSHAKLTTRHRTLQEGVLSHHLIFPLKGSLAYLRLLKPNYDEGFSLSDLPLLGEARQLLNNERAAESSNDPLLRMEDEAEPLRDRVRHEIFNFAMASLNVEEYRNYARGSVSTRRRL
jgi:hypothetical protein